MEATWSTPDNPRRLPFDQQLSSRLDTIIIRLEATKPKTIARGWARLQKRLAEIHVPAIGSAR